MHTIVLIDAHGADHGLYVAVYRGEVTIKTWAQLCEPDHDGNVAPHLRHAVVPLGELLSGRHLQGYEHLRHASMCDRVTHAATCWLGYYSGQEEWLEEDELPCQHFCNQYGFGTRRVEPWPTHMVCPNCGGVPEPSSLYTVENLLEIANSLPPSLSRVQEWLSSSVRSHTKGEDFQVAADLVEARGFPVVAAWLRS